MRKKIVVRFGLKENTEEDVCKEDWGEEDCGENWCKDEDMQEKGVVAKG